MENQIESSLSKIRNFHQEIRKMEKEIRSIEHDLESDAAIRGYWPESRLYILKEEKKTEVSEKQSDMDYIVPWQMF